VEYRGVANAVAKSCWLRQLLQKLGYPPKKAMVYFVTMSVQLICPKIQCIINAPNIKIDLHFVRDKVSRGEVKVLHVPSASQFVDIFTKGLPRALFEDFRSSLNVHPRPD
jgi:hypothetical protein